VLSLTPQTDQTLHCSDFARSIDLSPAGTAISASVIAVIETPLPWPKPVFDHDLLLGLKSKFETKSGPGRILASVPHPGLAAEYSVVRTFWRTADGTINAAHQVPDGELVKFAAELAETGQFAPSFETSRLSGNNYSLVCTQGSHDICCGGAGMRYAVTLEQNDALTTVMRVSHTGGHRFAPTALTFPDGRMWAFLTPQDAQALADRSVSTAELAPKCRGWWGAAPGPAQAAEIAVWSRVGWQWDDAYDRTVMVGPSGMVQVSGMGRRFEVEVVRGREVPTIACNKPGGLPTKPGQEWDFVGLREF
jgi:hypothetical protein